MKNYEKSNGVEQCKNILDEELMEQDDNIRSSVFEFLNEEGMDIKVWNLLHRIGKNIMCWEKQL